MKSIILPNDIEKYVHKKIAKRIIICALLLVLVAPVVAFLCVRMEAANEVQLRLRIAFYMFAVVILPFAVSGVPIKLIDRTWRGKVISIKLDSSIAFHNEGKMRNASYTKNTVFLWVQTYSGKLKKINVKEFGAKLNSGAPVPNEGKIEHHTEDYSEGDTVYHFYGLPYYYVVKEKSDYVDCVVCGTQNDSKRKDCLECGHTLLKLDK